MCDTVNDTNPVYFSPVDANNRRLDLDTRPELCTGAVEVLASGDYMLRPPQPPSYIFLIDVSATAIQSGFTNEVCQGIRQAILSGEVPGGDRTLCGIITYDANLHFYDLDGNRARSSGGGGMGGGGIGNHPMGASAASTNGGGPMSMSSVNSHSNATMRSNSPTNRGDHTTPHMVVIADLEDIFLPFPDELLLPLQENADRVLNFLNQIPQLHKDNKIYESCLGSAIRACLMTLKHIGGKILAFSSTIPTAGPEGVLHPERNNARLQQQKDEINLLKTISLEQEKVSGGSNNIPDDYKNLALELVKNQMSCDLFVASIGPTGYTDLASMKSISEFSGGEVNYYDNFSINTSGNKLREEIQHNILRLTAWESILRVNVSKGWKISKIYGHFANDKGPDLLSVPNIHKDYTFSVVLETEENVAVVDSQCFIQIALLYTTSEAERRIRILTYSLIASNSHADLLQNVDPQVASKILMQQAVDRALTETNLIETRTWLSNRTAHIVQNSSHIEDQGLFAFLPLYIFGILKSPALAGGPGICCFLLKSYLVGWFLLFLIRKDCKKKCIYSILSCPPILKLFIRFSLSSLIARHENEITTPIRSPPPFRRACRGMVPARNSLSRQIGELFRTSTTRRA